MTEIFIFLGALAVIGGLIAAALATARQEGKLAERERESRDVRDETKEAKDARDAMAALPADDRRRRLQGWTRR